METGAARAAPVLVGLVAGVDLEALAVCRNGVVTLLASLQRAETAQRAAEHMAADMIQRPHVLGFKAQMRLRCEGLAVRTHEPEVLDRVGNIPAMVAVFPLTATAEAAHCRGGAAFVLGGECHLVRPAAAFRAISVHLAVDFVAAEVFADQARHHAAPAAVRVSIPDVAIEEDVGLARDAELGVPLPIIAELRIPARILMLEPLEVFFGLGFDAPEIRRPADREELRGKMDVVFLDRKSVV